MEVASTCRWPHSWSPTTVAQVPVWYLAWRQSLVLLLYLNFSTFSSWKLNRLRVTVQKVFVSITRLVHMQHHPWTERVILAFYNDNKYDKYGTWVAFSICSMLHNALIKCHISVTCSPHNGIHQKCVYVHYDYLLKMVYSLLILLYFFETHTHR